MSILDRILADKRQEVAAAMRSKPLDAVRSAALVQPPARSFAARLRPGEGDPTRLIAEIKRRSPSAGALASITDPVDVARTYASGGASAISVLTDPTHFGGSLDDLRVVRASVPVPVLRKDFLFAPYQLWEARAAGADAVLLIVAALASSLADPDVPDHADQLAPSAPGGLEVARDRLQRLMRVARSAGLEVLVEVHDAHEVAVALEARAPVIGINNRNLATFVTDLATTEALAGAIRNAPVEGGLAAGPDGRGRGRSARPPVIVSESGLGDAAAVARVRRAGAEAVLVGEALVRSADVAAKVREMASVGPDAAASATTGGEA